MKKFQINSMDEYLRVEKYLIDKGYRLFQFQYSYDSLEGFQALFTNCLDDDDIMIRCFLRDVQDAILDYNGMLY